MLLSPVLTLVLVTFALGAEIVALMFSNQVTCRPPAPVSLWNLFEQGVQRHPERTALTFADPVAPRSWTYHELQAATLVAAGELVERGVGEGSILAVIADRQLEVVAAYLAALRLGAAYLPIDPRFPAERIRYMLRDSAPRLVLSDRPIDLGQGIEVSLLGPERFGGAPRPSPVAPSDPERPAYVMYTSGSTGDPKGVVVPHRGVVRLVIRSDFYDFGGERVWLQINALSFDASILDLWGPLLNGGRSILFPLHGVPDLELLRRTVRDFGITSAMLTTSLFNSIVSTDASALTGIETIMVGGEALSVPHVRMAQEALRDVVIINAYGPTENSTCSTCYRVPRPISDAWTSIPIGQAISGTTAYVLDEQGHPVGSGEVGELVVGGFGVALGYLNKPELTAERFISDPFISESGRLMYRTGDLVRDLGDGILDFCGRNDTQVKIRGNRVELGEIENLMLSHPEVTDAKVRVKLDGNGEKHLVGYYLTNTTEPDDLPDLLARHLPNPLIPAHLIRLAYMPLTQHGKLDDARLPNPFEHDLSRYAREGESLMDVPIQWSAIPDLVESLWRLVLPPGSAFSRSDSFFEVGGTSLGTLQVAARLSRELDRHVPVTKLFEFPSIERLSEYLVGGTTRPHMLTASDQAARAREARARRRGRH